MIVNTGVMFNDHEGMRIPTFLLLSKQPKDDYESLKPFRLSLILDRDCEGNVFLEVAQPDKKITLARSQPLPGELLEMLSTSLEIAPSEYRIALSSIEKIEESYVIPHGGDDLLDPEGEAGLACHYLDKGDWESAKGLLEEVKSKRPWLNGLRSLLGRCEIALGNDEKAEREYLAELDRVPTSHLVLNNLGILYKRRGWLEHAFDSFNRALLAYPNHYESLINFSTILFYFGDLGGVRYCLARALAIHPEGGLVDRSLMALAEKIDGDIDELRKAVEKRAEDIDLNKSFTFSAEMGKKDLKSQEAYRCFVEEAFKDGHLETWEREVLSVAAKLLNIPVDLQCRIVVDAQQRYWQDELPSPGPLDAPALFRRLESLAKRDGVIGDKERELLQRVAALLGVKWDGVD